MSSTKVKSYPDSFRREAMRLADHRRDIHAKARELSEVIPDKEFRPASQLCRDSAVNPNGCARVPGRKHPEVPSASASPSLPSLRAGCRSAPAIQTCVACLSGSRSPASAAAIEDTTLLFLPKREFLDLCRANSEVTFAVIRTLAWRFRYMASLVEELSLKEVSHRLARFLRDRALRSGVRTKRGLEFPLDETNQEIGSEIGTVRDLVSRNLRRFVDRGTIKMERRRVIVLDMAELEAQIAGTKRAAS